MKVMIAILPWLMLVACSTSPDPQPVRPPSPPIVGGDQDAHGCIGSAGYLWCEKQRQCVRPWMLPPVAQEGNTLKERIAHHCEVGASAP